MRNKSILLNCLLYLLLLTVICPAVTGKIIYVDDDAPVSSVEDRNGGLNDGTSWQDAYTYLQDALTDANSSNKPVEIRVAQGIYKPDRGAEQTPGDSEEATFQLINGVTIAGGYAGLGELDPNERNIELYETILSGDLEGNDVDVDVNDPYDLFKEPTRFDNSDNIVKGINTDETAVLDGFTITGGFIWIISSIDPRRGGGPIGGAGMYIYSGSPTIIDCTFTGNVTGNTGGGLLIDDDSNPTLLNCKFTRNYAESGGGIFSSGSNPTLINCIFSDNYVQHNGSGMFTYDGNPNLTNCTFRYNSTREPLHVSYFKGGGIYNENNNPVLTNCSFVENSASYGGAMCNEGCNSLLNNCEFVGNTASIGAGAISNSGQLIADGCIFDKNYEGAIRDYSEIGSIFTDCTFSDNSTPYEGGAVYTKNATFTRCIFAGNRSMGYYRNSERWFGYGGAVFIIYTSVFNNCTFVNNWAEKGSSIYYFNIAYLNNCVLRGIGNQIGFYGDSDPIFVNYSNIQGGREGEGNIDEDPLFVNPGYWADDNDPNIVVEPNDPNAVWIEGDYHLKSQAGRWDPNSETWVIDDMTSPCIDAGDPNSPIGDEPFPNGGIINMGAYGGSSQASKSFNYR